MAETVLQELNRRLPFTAGLQGEELAESISMNREAIEEVVLWHMFIRMAMWVAAAETPGPRWSNPERFDVP